MTLNQIISHRPHNAINQDKFCKHLSQRQAQRIPLLFFSDTKEHLNDIDDICQEIRDKDYQVKVEYNTYNVGDRDMWRLIEKKGLIDPLERRQTQPSRDQYMNMRMMGLDPEAATWDEHWVHEKSFIKESIEINITNRHIQTSIEKKFADGKRLDYTKDSLNFELFTTTETIDHDVVFDDDVEECIDRCKFIIDADDVDTHNYSGGINITLIKFVELPE